MSSLIEELIEFLLALKEIRSIEVYNANKNAEGELAFFTANLIGAIESTAAMISVIEFEYRINYHTPEYYEAMTEVDDAVPATLKELVNTLVCAKNDFYTTTKSYYKEIEGMSSIFHTKECVRAYLEKCVHYLNNATRCNKA